MFFGPSFCHLTFAPPIGLLVILSYNRYNVLGEPASRSTAGTKDQRRVATRKPQVVKTEIDNRIKSAPTTVESFGGEDNLQFLVEGGGGGYGSRNGTMAFLGGKFATGWLTIDSLWRNVRENSLGKKK